MTPHSNDWDARYDALNDYTPLTTVDVDALLQHYDTSAPKTHLDIGCGTGQVCRELYHRGFKSCGIETSTSALAIAKRSTIIPQDDVAFIEADVHSIDVSLPFAPYGLITMKYVYTFLNDKAVALTNTASLLAGNGTLLILNPNPEKLPPEKQGIATPHQEVISQLSEHFKVESTALNRDFLYVCKKD